MSNGMVFLVACGAVVCVGTIGTVYQIYQMVLTDARARGLKHPRLWGMFAMNGNQSSGFLVYLIVRRKYPVIHMSEEDRRNIEYRKKAAGVGLVFLAIGAIGLVVCSMVFLNI
ncbi:MAG: hypothetical protein Q4F79_12205 [Eubacteriales bacterium]|nr:hypothetical protein [Eubacteriales bacterium]